MTEDERPVGEDDLHAYADGRLDPARKAAVARHLAEDSEAAAKVADWQAQNEAIRALYLPYGTPHSEDGLIVAGRRSARRLPGLSEPSANRALKVAAFAALFMLGVAAGQLLPPILGSARPTATEPPIAALPQEARSAFLIYASEVRHPVEVGASEREHLQTWLGKRLGYAFRLPDLSRLGFDLVGGRLVPVAGRAGALLMYQDRGGRRVTVLIGRNEANRETSFRYESDGRVETFYWIDGPAGYAVTGEMARAELQAVADECYRQMPG